MKKISVFCSIAMILFACSEPNNNEESFATRFIPVEEGSGLRFRAYVTDVEQELIGDIHYFTREYSHSDTIDGLPVYAFFSGDSKSYFYQGEDGMIAELVTVDLQKRVYPYGVDTRKPVFLQYWQTRFKKDEGIGTEWAMTIDTTVTAYDAGGEPLELRYHYSAKARFDGWSQTALPLTQRVEKVLDVEVYEEQNYILNVTSGDSLFVKNGTAHYYFRPDIGMVKYISDYILKDRRNDYVRRFSTWEIMDKTLPKS